jgi:hypothetical protein
VHAPTAPQSAQPAPEPAVEGFGDFLALRSHAT